MNDSVKIVLIVLVWAAVVALAIFIPYKATKGNKPMQAQGFICVADAEVTEQHVGVTSATYMSDGTWRINYVDAAPMIYRQVPGETCGAVDEQEITGP